MPESIVQQLGNGNVAQQVDDQLAPQSALAKQVTAQNPELVRSFIAKLFGIPDAMRAIRGEMTEDEAKNFAVMSTLGLIPGAGELGPAAKVAEEVAPEAAQSITQMIRAFHGSPYDFDKFSLDKIGTGEGAQAYGHGLYFAENPAVAESYKQPSGPQSAPIWYKGTSVLGHPQKELDALPDLTKTALNFARMDSNIDEAIFNAKAYNRSDIANELERLRSVGDLQDNPRTSGKFYEVNIAADPEHFLDWDKPLSEQSARVQKALEGFGGLPKGQTLRNSMEGRHVVDLAGNDPVAATDALRQAGIPGIKYLDQGSRGVAPRYTVFDREGNTVARGLFDADTAARRAQEVGGRYETTQAPQTSNYVVFDDNIINIVKKYGLAGLIAAGAANFTPKEK